MIQFSQMLSIFLTGMFISLLVQAFSWNVLGLMRRVLGLFRISSEVFPSGGR